MADETQTAIDTSAERRNEGDRSLLGEDAKEVPGSCCEDFQADDREGWLAATKEQAKATRSAVKTARRAKPRRAAKACRGS
jgi:hypothetical protein